MLINFIKPQDGDTVYDGAMGTGGMLIEAIRHMKHTQSSYGKIYGQEKNLATSAIGRMNLFLHGARDFNVVQGDTLRNPGFLKRGSLQTFDCVIANPPFSLKNWGAEAFSSDIYGRNIWGCPSDSCADFAWLQHMVSSMDPKKGRCAIILPQGVLFHGGKDGEMRQKLVESDKLEAVVTFVSGVFYSTGVSACALILNNNKSAEHKNKICLVDASNIYTPKRAQNIMTDDDIKQVCDLYADYKDVIEKCKIVTLDDVKAKDYTLSVNSYIEKKQQEAIDPAVVKKEFLEALNAVTTAEDKLKRLLVEGGYIHE